MLVLASASPRRVALLEAAGFACDVRPVGIDESRRGGEAATAYVERLALDKAGAAAAACRDRVVLGADTAVVVDSDVFGKPADADDARAMLRRLRGRTHLVLTGVAIVAPGDFRTSFVESTTVWLSEMSDADVDWYVASGEPADKAGAYAIQGLASRFIPRIDGSYTNVVGLPVAAVAAALARPALAGLLSRSLPSVPSWR